MKGLKHSLQLLFELTKMKLSLMITFSGGTGFLLAYQGIFYPIGPTLLGIFLLASGASALNQVQERKEDLLMERTKNRPVPSGRLSPKVAFHVSSFFLISGFSVLYGFASQEAFGLGLLAVLIYNGIYTPLKKKTLFAILPGALVGALPPAIGWFGAGGSMDPQIVALCSFFFLWQIPHSWVLLIEYQKDYQKAGFPSLVSSGGRNQVKKISWVWMIATTVCSLFIPLFGARGSWFNLGGLLLLSSLLTLKTSNLLLFQSHTRSLHFAYRAVNLYGLSVMIILNLDLLFQHFSLSFLTG